MLIVTDGAVDIEETLEQSPNVRVVPGEVWLDEAPFVGGIGEFWALLRRGTYPSTTPPTVAALLEAYGQGDRVCALHVSGVLSATLTRAQDAASRTGADIAVIDTRSLSVGAGLVATVVHRATESSSDNESVLHLARSLPDRLHTFALVQEVEALRRSDRAGMLPKGHLARNHPLLLAVRGRVVALEQPKNRSAGLKLLTTHLRHSAGTEIAGWALGHGDLADHDAVVEQLSQALGKPPSFVTRLHPTVGVHLGPDAIVVGAVSGRMIDV
jgi:DegV family protein with EDD domain